MPPLKASSPQIKLCIAFDVIELLQFTMCRPHRVLQAIFGATRRQAIERAERTSISLQQVTNYSHAVDAS